MAPVVESVPQDRNAVIAGTLRVFGEIGVTAEDLRQWAPWCAALGELADAMDTAANTTTAGRDVRHHDRP